MKKAKIFLMLFLIVFLVSLGCSEVPQKPTEQQVSSYPKEYTGTVAISTWNVCDTKANATFTAFDNNTCVLQVTFENAYQNFEGLLPGDDGYGACKPVSGDIQGWTIYGDFDKTSQVCIFRYCNEKGSYYAGGRLTFTSTEVTASEVIDCYGSDDGEKKIAVTIDTLAPSIP